MKRSTISLLSSGLASLTTLTGAGTILWNNSNARNQYRGLFFAPRSNSAIDTPELSPAEQQALAKQYNVKGVEVEGERTKFGGIRTVEATIPSAVLLDVQQEQQAFQNVLSSDDVLEALAAHMEKYSISVLPTVLLEQITQITPVSDLQRLYAIYNPERKIQQESGHLPIEDVQLMLEEGVIFRAIESRKVDEKLGQTLTSRE